MKVSVVAIARNLIPRAIASIIFYPQKLKPIDRLKSYSVFSSIEYTSETLKDGPAPSTAPTDHNFFVLHLPGICCEFQIHIAFSVIISPLHPLKIGILAIICKVSLQTA
ncbi:hypothetical protein [Tychonema sp. LEGE 07203]|uniref:hypothetical protein n=1 Tax=Tychonema sp. LEGE 07203 TaxID=1828671 RepID=UPI001881981B|nr:hypothetical protein [Tychonema sp. LEGE 07203]MBE9094625.1 hypothetical protein [Tychonema sp. LEGE 07203]